MSRLFALAGLFLIAPLLSGCVQEETLPPPPTDPEPVLEWIVPVPPQVDAKELLANHKKFVKEFPIRENNSPDHKGAREFMFKEFNESGLEAYRQEFNTGDLDQENICGLRLGAIEPTTWVVVGAHYDTTTNNPEHIGSEGAYDDGSGTRMIIEMAKSYAKITPYYSVAFCAFDGEERGLHGSNALYKEMSEENTSFPHLVEKTRAMLDLDMFGICYPVSVPIAYDHNNVEIYKFMDAKRKELKVPDDLWRPADLRLGTSDFGVWKRQDIPTVFYISDFEFMGVPGVVPGQPTTPGTPAGAYPFWHQADTYETMEAMAGSAASLEAGFQTAVDIAMATLVPMALDPSVKLAEE